MKKYTRFIPATILFLFASLTFFLSSSVIFDLFGIREKEGNYVLFVVIANFISSLIYFAAVYGFLKREKWTFKILIISVLIIVAAFIGLQFHIDAGGLYEAKTVKALMFRGSVTALFSIVAYYTINKVKIK